MELNSHFLHNSNQAKPCFRKMQILAISRPFFAANFENIYQKRIELTRKDKHFQLCRGLGRA